MERSGPTLRFVRWSKDLEQVLPGTVDCFRVAVPDRPVHHPLSSTG